MNLNLDRKIRKIVFSADRAEFIQIYTTVFAFIYHFSFLIVFYKLNILPMFYFNIFSSILFSSQLVFFFSKKIKDIFVPFCLAYVEVIAHQILGDYYLGAQAGFHYFILLIGLLAFLVFNNRFRFSMVIGICSSMLFAFIESFSIFSTPVYEISPVAFLVIHCVNIFFSISLILAIIMFFVYMVLRLERNLEKQVAEQTDEIRIQHSKIEKLQNNVIVSLSSLVENRDADTGEHIQRTGAYVEMIAKKAFEIQLYPSQINAKFSSLLKRAAPMHDVGKIVVPDSILKKPGKLDFSEFEEMKRHTSEGGRIVKEIIGIAEDIEYLETAIAVATYHHERWDGTGYPNGLKGEEIPVSARIMAIADVFDALVSPRYYKEPMPQEEAFRIIQEEAGTHFDPKLVDVFLSIKEEAKNVLKIYQR